MGASPGTDRGCAGAPRECRRQNEECRMAGQSRPKPDCQRRKPLIIRALHAPYRTTSRHRCQRFARSIGLHPYERRASYSAFCLLPSSFMWPPPYRPHTATIPPGLLQSAPGRTKEKGGMKNAESGGRLCLAMRENHASEGRGSKPPQGSFNATSMRVDSQLIATLRPP